MRYAEGENSKLEAKLSETFNKVEEKERVISDMRYQTEKDQFQLTVKEENLTVARDQLRRQEASFKEDVEKVRKEFYEQLTKEYNHQQVDHTL